MATRKNSVFSKTGVQIDNPQAPPQGQLLICVSQQQEHHLEVQVNERRVESLRGPLDQIRWQDLEFAVQMVRDALVRCGAVSSEMLVSEAVIVQSAQGWNPVIELRLLTLDDDQIDLPRIHAVAVEVLQDAVRGNSGTDDMTPSALQPGDLGRIRAVAEEGLSKMGGRAIRHPLEVTMHKQPLARLEGKFAARPDFSDFHPVPRELSGRLHGFNMHKEALLFDSDDHGEILVSYGKLDVDLIAVARLCKAGGKCALRVHQTTERRGQRLYAFVGIVSCAEDAAVSLVPHSR